MTIEYTTNFGLAVPDFLSSPWHQELQDDLYKIDQLIAAGLAGTAVGAWANSTDYSVGMIAIDTTTGAAFVVNVAHTSAATPTTFAAYRAANPTFYSQTPYMPRFRGAWANSTAYAYFDIVYESASGIFAIALDSHTSAAGPATITADAAHWTFMTHFNQHDADAIVYANGASGLAATDVQEALDELALEKAPIDSPAFIGVPTAPTAVGNVLGALVNVAFLAQEINELIGDAPAGLQTLGDIADALGDNADFNATIVAALALKAPLLSPVFTGAPEAPHQLAADNSTKLATTHYVDRAVLSTAAIPAGTVVPFAGMVVPDGYLFCDGTAHLRADHATLFETLVRSGTVTFSGDRCTWTAHRLKAMMPIKFTTTGTLPAPLVVGTTYWLRSTNADSFELSSSAGSAAIDLTTAGSGVHTAVCAPYGDGNGTTTFNVPELQGAFVRGWDLDRGLDGDRGFGSNQTDAMKAHTHLYDKATSTPGIVFAAGGDLDLLQTPTASAEAADDRTETRPYNVALRYIIKT